MTDPLIVELVEVAADALAAFADLVEASLEMLAAAARLAIAVASLDLDVLRHVAEEPHPHWT